MTIDNLLFSLFAFFSLLFSLFVILSKNPVHSILSLILVFFNTASLLIFLGVEFLAMLFIIVYVGAVAVLFLFVIMLLNIKISNLNVSIYRYLPIITLFAAIFFFELFFGFNIQLFEFGGPSIYNDVNFFNAWGIHTSTISNISTVGFVLYTYYSYYFLFSGVILLLSMIGAITLTLHRRSDVRKQLIYKQIQRDFSSAISWKI